jgi:hypothetical protein
MRRIVRYFVLRPAAFVGVLVAVVLVVAAVAAVPFLLPSIPGLNTLRSQPEPAATGEFLRGQRDYNAQQMWANLSSDAQQRMRSQGGSLEELQRQMESARQSGFKLEEISYVGGKALPDGTSVQVYLVGYRPQARADLDYQSFMFTLDRDGKIARVQ